MFKYIFISFVFINFEIIYAIKSFNLQHHCGMVISLQEENVHSAILQYDHESYIQDFILNNFYKMGCTVQISGWRDQDLILQFIEFNINNWQTMFGIVQGDSWKDGEKILGLRKQFSFFNSFSNVYTTKYWKIFIQLMGKPPDKGTQVFKLVVNTYHTGKCTTTEHRCNNGRCIHDSVKCNGYNPCGDHSDCPERAHTKTLVTLALIILTLLLLVSFVTCIVVVMHRDRKRQRSRESSEETAARRTENGRQHNGRRRNNRNMTVTYNLVGLNIINSPGNDVIMHPTEPTEPPSYDSVIAEDERIFSRDELDLDARAEVDLEDYIRYGDSPITSSENSDDENQNDRRIRYNRRPCRRHSSRYLPRYSEVQRNRDAYEVRGDEDQIT